ncbi:SusC/RagA family TonB-linked outer membrane protein [Chitinophaga agrisoli]|uniref:SusC/RagA family TonB-linked outer membrane protein n=1 Tax=Chitinophaga agrisoli TaxID=2607653 RepID=A0A5B2VGW2_9BACT|nr:SusC/RagA family TonB-linked outer membrane protein [Chitinophaga agrisoli]KAA2238813.1 SusC/RagA family TonB-linked outer membrane protein [Chitinophaga agrisoli]
MRRLIPKFSIIAILAFLTAIPLTAQSQVIPPGERTITYTARKIRIKDFFETVWEQTRLQAFYNDEQLDSYEIISVDFKNVPLDKALAWLLNKRRLTWSYRRGTFVIFPIKKNSDTALSRIIVAANTRSVTGIVCDEKMRPLPGVSVFTDTIGSVTDANGRFKLADMKRGSILQVRKSGYKPMLLSSYADSISIQLIALVAPLKLIDVSGTQQRQLTASISGVSEKDIETQPASNVLSIIQGRVSGLYINQTTGLPGGGYNIRLRGRNSIESITDPLILIDGVPLPPLLTNNFFEKQKTILQQDVQLIPLANIASSPLNLLSIHDIASIEVLKDADATALYGTKGANGVILIISKTPAPGEQSLTVNIYSGIGQATRFLRLLDSKQYTEMRRQAIRNDGRAASTISDYDILLWDTTKYTDWQRRMIGGTAHITDASLEIKGSRRQLFWRLSGLYRAESTVYPSSQFNYRKGSGRAQLNYSDKKGKIKTAASVSYVADRNILPAVDVTSFSTTPPTTPELYAGGKLNFANDFGNNPYVNFLQKSTEKSSIGQGFIRNTYAPAAGWLINAAFGFNYMKNRQVQVYPMSSFNPKDSMTAYSNFLDNRYQTTMFDASTQWKKQFNNTRVSVLFGTRLFWEHMQQEGVQEYFANDASLYGRSGAIGTLELFKPDSNFRAGSIYARAEVKRNDKYIVTFTASRDNSNRINNQNYSAVYGTVGAAWVFSRERWFNDSSFFSYGRLHGSWGYSGNDQYRERADTSKQIVLMDLLAGFGNSLARAPHAEKIRKAEIAVEMGFLDDKLTGTICYYNNRSWDQLLTAVYSNALNVGIPVNYPAVIVNRGVEVDVAAQWFRSGPLRINSSINISFPDTKLLDFPHIEEQDYRNFYRIGAPLDVALTYGMEGVDAGAGLYKFAYGGSDPQVIQKRPYAKSLVPVFYGGFQNNIVYKGFQLDLLFRFARQNNYNADFGLAPEAPGTMYNQPVTVLDRWQEGGDNVPVQRYTTNTGTVAGRLYKFALLSDKRIAAVNYLRLQSLMLGYQWSDRLLKRMKISSCRLYLQGVNLFTITNYKGRDPELITDEDIYPSLRVMTAGIQLSL